MIQHAKATQLSASVREFVLSAQESREFAEFSGDFNPLHVDPLAARRSPLGQCVVHGLHVVMRALDSFFTDKSGLFALKKLSAWFRGPISHGTAVCVEVVAADERQVRIELRCGAEVAQVVTCEFEDCDSHFPCTLETSVAPSRCRHREFSELEKAAGSVPLGFDFETAAVLFPRLNRCLPAIQLAEIAAISRVVGMECPGQNSLLIKFELSFDQRADSPLVLHYKTTRAIRQISQIALTICGPGLSGKVDTLFRPPPVNQSGLQRVQQTVEAGEFAGVSALVVGGSRGLGEVAAKVIAAGDGDVLLTYKSGKTDAMRVAHELRSAGKRCDPMPFDVTAPPATLNSAASSTWKPNWLLYFATPPIGLTKTIAWDSAKFQRFCEYYVSGFERTIRAASSLFELDDWPLHIFYPSTVLLDTGGPIAAEYAAAKAAGEAVCRFLDGNRRRQRCHWVRLPRMLTDQTNSFVAVHAEDAVDVILSALRSMRDRYSEEEREH